MHEQKSKAEYSLLANTMQDILICDIHYTRLNSKMTESGSTVRILRYTRKYVKPANKHST